MYGQKNNPIGKIVEMSDGQDELESDTTGTLDADEVHMWVKCCEQAPSVDEDGGGSIRGQGGVMVQGQMKRTESWLIQSASATALSSMAHTVEKLCAEQNIAFVPCTFINSGGISSGFDEFLVKAFSKDHTMAFGQWGTSIQSFFFFKMCNHRWDFGTGTSQ